MNGYSIYHSYFLGKAVIYGVALASYTFIQGMLACGVPGSRLVMVQPPTNLPSSFNNPEVDDLVEKSLENSGNYCINAFHFLSEINLN